MPTAYRTCPFCEATCGLQLEVEDGHVTLNGVVRTKMDRRRADILVRALGALGVDNRLRVLTEDKDDTKRSVA